MEKVQIKTVIKNREEQGNFRIADDYFSVNLINSSISLMLVLVSSHVLSTTSSVGLLLSATDLTPHKASFHSAATIAVKCLVKPL